MLPWITGGALPCGFLPILRVSSTIWSQLWLRVNSAVSGICCNKDGSLRILREQRMSPECTSSASVLSRSSTPLTLTLSEPTGAMARFHSPHSMLLLSSSSKRATTWMFLMSNLYLFLLSNSAASSDFPSVWLNRTYFCFLSKYSSTACLVCRIWMGTLGTSRLHRSTQLWSLRTSSCPNTLRSFFFSMMLDTSSRTSWFRSWLSFRLFRQSCSSFTSEIPHSAAIRSISSFSLSSILVKLSLPKSPRSSSRAAISLWVSRVKRDFSSSTLYSLRAFSRLGLSLFLQNSRRPRSMKRARLSAPMSKFLLLPTQSSESIFRSMSTLMVSRSTCPPHILTIARDLSLTRSTSLMKSANLSVLAVTTIASFSMQPAICSLNLSSESWSVREQMLQQMLISLYVSVSSWFSSQRSISIWTVLPLAILSAMLLAISARLKAKMQLAIFSYEWMQKRMRSYSLPMKQSILAFSSRADNCGEYWATKLLQQFSMLRMIQGMNYCRTSSMSLLLRASAILLAFSSLLTISSRLSLSPILVTTTSLASACRSNRLASRLIMVYRMSSEGTDFDSRSSIMNWLKMATKLGTMLKRLQTFSSSFTPMVQMASTWSPSWLNCSQSLRLWNLAKNSVSLSSTQPQAQIRIWYSRHTLLAVCTNIQGLLTWQPPSSCGSTCSARKARMLPRTWWLISALSPILRKFWLLAILNTLLRMALWIGSSSNPLNLAVILCRN